VDEVPLAQRLVLMLQCTVYVHLCVFITAVPFIKLFAWVFFTAVPIVKLFGRGIVEDMFYERRRAEACVE
jgi:hypothetical protein